MWAATARYRYIEEVVQSVLSKVPAKFNSQSLDNLVMNRKLGIPIFLCIMYMTFLFAIQLGNSWVDFFYILSGVLFIDTMHYVLDLAGANDFAHIVLADGVGGGIQTVITFIPIVAPLFIVLNLLENSGYLSRAAFVIDGVMKKIGLPGQSFTPMAIGFGCSVPAIMATRILNKKHERIITGMMTPFMSCGARLPIYVLFAATFFSLITLLYLCLVCISLGF